MPGCSRASSSLCTEREKLEAPCPLRKKSKFFEEGGVHTSNWRPRRTITTQQVRLNKCSFPAVLFPWSMRTAGFLLCMHLFRTRQTRVQCLCTDDDVSDRLAVLSEMARRCGPKCSARSGAALSSSTGLRASSERCSSNPVLELNRAESILLMVLVVVCVAAILFPGLILVPHLDDFFDAMQLSQAESPPASSCWHGFEFNATLGYPGEGPPSPFSATVSHARLVKMGGPVDKGKGHPLAFVLAWTALGGTVSAPGNDPASGEVWLPRPRLYSQVSAKRELHLPCAKAAELSALHNVRGSQ